MAELDSIPIRCELIVRSNPPETPFDVNTELVPQAWRGAELAIDVGVFDTRKVSVDLGNLVWLECDIYPMPLPNTCEDTNFSQPAFSNLPFPTTPPAPLISVTLEADDIDPTITRAGWIAGTEQNAQFRFTYVQTQSLDLGGRPKRKFWIVIHGMTEAGTRIVYGAGPLFVFESGAQTIYLPNNLAPLVIPEGTTLYIFPNQQMPFAIPIDVEGTLDVGGVLVDVTCPDS